MGLTFKCDAADVNVFSTELSVVAIDLLKEDVFGRRDGVFSIGQPARSMKMDKALSRKVW